MRGGCRCLQFYGRGEWHYGGVCIGLAGAIGIINAESERGEGREDGRRA